MEGVVPVGLCAASCGRLGGWLLWVEGDTLSALWPWCGVLMALLSTMINLVLPRAIDCTRTDQHPEAPGQPLVLVCPHPSQVLGSSNAPSGVSAPQTRHLRVLPSPNSTRTLKTLSTWGPGWPPVGCPATAMYRSRLSTLVLLAALDERADVPTLGMETRDADD
jgi:hypothetical protein